ncbi:urate oxidase [Puccinia striiformis f. sp. tritici PST-78]|uniref:Uricase n=1 Tax=Puccinia striiformis f. sp. tritici PST-78 TaxID=1165861 RepID=A0A0L0VN42_9BASI|nr:urate oxidase [Puccinia striiformis f. sp. tritici PST-78]
MSPFPLVSARYGKENVRVFRVVKTGTWHEVVEYTVSVLLEGQIESSFTKADNSVVVATDSMKNTINVFAKTSPHVLTPELFSIHLGLHFVSEYEHIDKAIVTIISHRWSRIPLDQKPHPHAFTRDGNDVTRVEAIVTQSNTGSTSVELITGLQDLLVLKTTGSSFENFVRDKWTTLPEASDRILSTSVDCRCAIKIDLPSDNSIAISSITNLGIDFKTIGKSIRDITLETFATDESASVQATLYKMCQLILTAHPEIVSVSYNLPNKHYIPIDLSWHDNIQNTSVQDAEVFVPLDAPSGLITATVSR